MAGFTKEGNVKGGRRGVSLLLCGANVVGGIQTAGLVCGRLETGLMGSGAVGGLRSR